MLTVELILFAEDPWCLFYHSFRFLKYMSILYVGITALSVSVLLLGLGNAKKKKIKAIVFLVCYFKKNKTSELSDMIEKSFTNGFPLSLKTDERKCGILENLE